MAVVKIELELDWFNEENSLDDVIKHEVIANLQNRLVANAEKEITESLNKIVDGMATKVADGFLEETLKTKIEDLQIPYKESSWSSR